MAEQLNWREVLGIDDPAPGDPIKVRRLADAYGQVADDAANARDLLNSAQLAAGKGETMRAFHDRMGKLPEHMTLLATSYGSARDALTAYAGTLRDAQDQAGRAWSQASPAHADLTAAQADVKHWQHRLDTADPNDQAARADATNHLNDAQARVRDAQGRLDAAHSLAGQAAELRAGAARRTAATLDDAAGHSIPERSIWQKISDWFHDNPVIGYLLDALAFVLPFLGPVGVALGLVAGAISLGSQVLDMALTGHFDIASLVLGVVSLIPGAAFTKFGKVIGSATKDLGAVGKLTGLSGAGGGLDKAASAIKDIGYSIQGAGSTVVKQVTVGFRKLGAGEGPAWSVKDINPGFSDKVGVGDPLRKTNCVDCSIALDKSLAGKFTVASRGKPKNYTEVEKEYGKNFQPVWHEGKDLAEKLQNHVLRWGPDGRGIVNAERDVTTDNPTGVGHMFNVINRDGEAWFLDGERGLEHPFSSPEAQSILTGPGTFGPFVNFTVLRTDQ